MSASARSKVFAMQSGAVQITACWSGYWTKDTSGQLGGVQDQVAADPAGIPNDFRECSVQVYGWSPAENPGADPSFVHTINPRTGMDVTSGQAIRVDCSKQFPVTTVTNDMASNFSASSGASANRVSVLACYPWSPPLAGFLLIPRTVMLHAVVIEGLEYQQ